MSAPGRLALGAAALALAALGACAGSLPSPTAADATRAGVSLERLTAGRGRYVAKCSSCHAPFAPTERTADEWHRALDDMADEAHLAASDRELIGLYLRSLARR